MSESIQNVALLGSTGSIGRSALEVIAASRDRLSAYALTGHTKLDRLAQQAQQHGPRFVVTTDPDAANSWDRSGLPTGTEVLSGEEGIARIVSDEQVDIVLAAIVGAAGLQGTWAALEAGKTVALANKETLVMAGPLVMELARERNARMLPVDSEHSAVFQAMQSGQNREVERIVLTASGGPFLDRSLADLANVTVDDALAHPTWDMGPKITVDSATMMNKALEIIEARWLFDMEPEKIDVVIHPQSIVHSLVEFVDGSVIAQMSPPDMKLPIQYALTWPDRVAGAATRLDLTDQITLDFRPPDLERFEALRLGHEAARVGGTAGAVLNAANEAAVAGFLAGEIPFAEITTACRNVLENHNFDPSPSLADLMAIDRWARLEVSRWISS